MVLRQVFLPALPGWLTTFNKDCKKMFSSLSHLGLPHTDVTTKSPYWKYEPLP